MEKKKRTNFPTPWKQSPKKAKIRAANFWMGISGDGAHREKIKDPENQVLSGGKMREVKH